MFKLWLAANERPRVNADDGAMWRRILQLPFVNVIPEAERDERVKLALRSDPDVQAAILAWAVPRVPENGSNEAWTCPRASATTRTRTAPSRIRSAIGWPTAPSTTRSRGRAPPTSARATAPGVRPTATRAHPQEARQRP